MKKTYSNVQNVGKNFALKTGEQKKTLMALVKSLLMLGVSMVSVLKNMFLV